MEKIEGIQLKITTRSNCLIGGAVPSYRIGEIDQCTALDEEGRPKITASAFKGACRNMFENEKDIASAEKIYRRYFDYIQKKIEERNIKEEIKKEKIKEIQELKDRSSISYLFGINGYNYAPKLLFSDFYVINERENKNYFSIDHKNTIEEDEKGFAIMSNPRTYKTIRNGISFKGEILTYRFGEFEKAGIRKEEILQFMKEIKKSLKKFSDGIYRLGNSKSRGYGKIQIDDM